VTVTNTTNLGLFKPDSAEIARRWADEEDISWSTENNEILLDFLPADDSLLTFNAEVYNTTGAGSALSLGSGGVAEGFYRVLPGDIIIGWGRFALGTSPFPSATGIMHVTLPVAPLGSFHTASTTLGAADILGGAVFRDNSTETESQLGVLQISTLTNARAAIGLEKNNSTFAQFPDQPFTYATGDRITYHFMYVGDI
jgi:hypothetical protein